MSDREKIADEIERHIAGFFTRDGMTEAAINAFAQCVMDNRETVLAALRSQGREDGAREMREASPSKAVVFRQLTDDERRVRAEALARAYRDERTAAHGNTAPWPAGCLKPNSCARHRRCMYAPSSEQCRHYGLDLTEAVARAEAAASPERTEAPDA